MFNKIPKDNKGFTLIELLVVVAIIGILSTVVFASLSETRGNARNKAKVELARQYINALELYYNENGNYPNYTTTPRCLGTGISDCQGGSISPDSDLNDDLEQYIPGPPADEYEVSLGSDDMTGISYVCADESDGDGVCTEYQLRWFLDGTDQSCGPSTNEEDFPPFGTAYLTRCTYIR